MGITNLDSLTLDSDLVVGGISTVTGAQTFTGVVTFSAIPLFPATGITLGSTTITETEIGLIDGVTPGTLAASKAMSLSAGSAVSGAFTFSSVVTYSAIPVFDTTGITLGSTTITEAEIGVIDGVTSGAALNGKALVVKRAIGNITTAQLVTNPMGANTLVAAVAGKIIVPLYVNLGFSGTAIDDAAADGNLELNRGADILHIWEADGLVDASTAMNVIFQGGSAAIANPDTFVYVVNEAITIDVNGTTFSNIVVGTRNIDWEIVYLEVDATPV